MIDFNVIFYSISEPKHYFLHKKKNSVMSILNYKESMLRVVKMKLSLFRECQ